MLSNPKQELKELDCLTQQHHQTKQEQEQDKYFVRLMFFIMTKSEAGVEAEEEKGGALFHQFCPAQEEANFLVPFKTTHEGRTSLLCTHIDY